MSNFTQRLLPSGKSILYDANFINILRSYFPIWLNSNTGFSTIEVEPTEANRYKGDLRGLLLLKGVPADIIFPTMLFNGIENSYEYDGIQSTFYVLERNEIDKIIQLYNVSQKIRM